MYHAPLAALAALCWAPLALAVPMTLTHSGRLVDASGGPLNGAQDLTVRLVDGDGAVQWSDTFSAVPLQDGYFAVVLGSGAALDASHLAADELYVGVSAGGAELRATTPLTSVPFSVRALDSVNVRGGVVEATTITGDTLTAGTIVGGNMSATDFSADSVTSGVIVGGNVSATDFSASTVTADAIDVGSVTADAIDVGSLSVDALTIGDLGFGAPVVGEWYPSDHKRTWVTNAYQFMTFDRERFNTDPSFFTYDGVNTITIHKAGWYRVDMRTITHNNGDGNHVETWKNGDRLHLSHAMHNATTTWRRHATSVVSWFDAGSTLQVRVYCSSGTVSYCYHAGPDYTALTVQRMR